MKKFLVVVLGVMLSLNFFAQITLDKSYTGSTAVSEVKSNEYIYYMMDALLSQCHLYDENHNYLKSINITLPPDYYLSDIKFVSRQLFNQDDGIEVLYISQKYVATESSYYYEYQLGVVNESGQELLVVPRGAYASVKEIRNTTKLLTYLYAFNADYSYYDVGTNIYNLGGNTNAVELLKSAEVSSVYPNPTDHQININAESLPPMDGGLFELHSLSGQKVLSHPLPQNAPVSISVNGITPGSYVYTIKNGDDLIETSKVLIK